MQKEKKIPNIVIVGGGFAGIATIKKLKKLDVKANITLVSKSDIFEYYPALYKLVTGALPIEVSVPIDVIFKNQNIEFKKETFINLDEEKQIIITKNSTDKESIFSYDYLVLALGSETNFFNIKGLPELSYSFKSVDAAIKLKKHFCDLFKDSKDLTKEQLVSMLHVVIVGGGPSGVELAGDLKHYLIDLAKHHKTDPSFITIDLIEASNRILPTLPEKVSIIAEARLRKMGVNIFTNRALASQEIEEVFLKDMKMSSHTVIWTAGTRINDTFNKIPGIILDDHKRVMVSDFLSLSKDNNVFIAGDGAATKYSGLAQTAIDHGNYIATNISKLEKGEKTNIYNPKTPSFVIPIGNYWAIFNHNNFVMSGFLPWILRSLIDMKYFIQIVPIKYVLTVFQKGKKYRKVYGGCEVE